MVRILTDDELDTHPAPASVMQSWLDAPRSDRSHFDSVVRAILNSRHLTEELLVQLRPVTFSPTTFPPWPYHS